MMICRVLTWSRVPLAIGYVLLHQFWQTSLGPTGNPALGPSIVLQGMLFVALITDWLDGMLARHWRVQSVEGALTDPLSDAILFILVFGVFQFGEKPPLCPLDAFLIIAIREVLMHSTIRPILLARRLAAGARWTGKFKTVMQSVVVFWISALPLLNRWVPALAPGVEATGWMCRFCALLSVASLFPYLSAIFHPAQAGPPGSAEPPGPTTPPAAGGPA
ncbi:MAG TPA: CDP-alcohol phosphatidyltransferase family protein [Planctomycetota bacterium]|nr:CDP-alcohol phosphatidyltransferase family protein [Planctomycetota bacterium]